MYGSNINKSDDVDNVIGPTTILSVKSSKQQFLSEN